MEDTPSPLVLKTGSYRVEAALSSSRHGSFLEGHAERPLGTSTGSLISHYRVSMGGKTGPSELASREEFWEGDPSLVVLFHAFLRQGRGPLLQGQYASPHLAVQTG